MMKIIIFYMNINYINKKSKKNEKAGKIPKTVF